MNGYQRDAWNRIEAKWLRGLLAESREPNPDPAYEMMGGVAHLSSNMRSIGLLSYRTRIEFSAGAWDVITKSPIILSAGSIGVPERSTLHVQTLMGIPVTVDYQLPDPIVVFRDSTGEVLRIVVLVDRRPARVVD